MSAASSPSSTSATAPRRSCSLTTTAWSAPARRPRRSTARRAPPTTVGGELGPVGRCAARRGDLASPRDNRAIGGLEQSPAVAGSGGLAGGAGGGDRDYCGVCRERAVG